MFATCADANYFNCAWAIIKDTTISSLPRFRLTGLYINPIINGHTKKVPMEYFKKSFLRFRRWLRDSLAYFIVFFLVLLMCIAFFLPRIVITIDSGEGGVLFRRFFGTVTDKVYTEGVYLIPPWDTMTVYDGRIQTVLHEFDVLTAQGLPIHLSLAIRFRPEYDMLGLLHQQVGPNYINTIITPEVESVIRKRLSLYDPEDIYMNKDKIMTQVVIEAIDALGQKYISANDVIIRNISLPDTIREAIESKLTHQQEAESYVYRLKSAEYEAKRKNIDAEGIKNYQDTISKSLSEKILKWQGIQATLELAKSTNSKVVVIGAGNTGMPLILGSEFSQDNHEAQKSSVEKSDAVKIEKPSLPESNQSPKFVNAPN